MTLSLSARPKASHLLAVPFLAVPLAGLAPAGAAEISTTAKYEVTIAGVQVATATATLVLDGDKYKVTAAAQAAGIAKIATTARGTAIALGQIGEGEIAHPTGYTITSKGKRDEAVRMALAGGIIRTLDVQPPVDKEDTERVKLTEQHLRGVIDPLSATVFPVTGADPLAPQTCNRTVPVFDGRVRFDLVMSFKRTENFDVGGVKGKAIVCSIQYRPIAGHRPERRETKFMMENRDIEVSLMPVNGARVLVPWRASIKTMVGTAVLRAVSIQAPQ